ncbi:uncharacterized protein V6R79_002124 [Siganus canaliculatus]
MTRNAPFHFCHKNTHVPLMHFCHIFFCHSILCSVLGVDHDDPKRRVLLELYVQTVLFCREQSYKMEQTSALLSIIKSIHEFNVESPLYNIEQCFDYCKELILCHSVRRPPFSINLFTFAEAKQVLSYIHNSYMKYYKLYKYIFTLQVKLDLSLTYSGIPDQDKAATEDYSVPEVENKLDKDAENKEEMEADKDVEAEKDNSYQTQEAQPEGYMHSSELKELIKKEVREQLMLMSGHLDQQMNETANQHSRVQQPSQLKAKAKR